MTSAPAGVTFIVKFDSQVSCEPWSNYNCVFCLLHVWYCRWKRWAVSPFHSTANKMTNKTNANSVNLVDNVTHVNIVINAYDCMMMSFLVVKLLTPLANHYCLKTTSLVLLR